MEKIKLKDLYDATQVSSRNTEAWRLVAAKAKEFRDNEIEVDTEGIMIEDPTGNVEFRKMMTDQRIKLVLHNSTSLTKQIKVFCLACGYSEDRVRNEGVIEEIVIVKKLFDDALVKELMDSVQEDGSEMYLDISKVVSQVGSDKTVMSIIETIKRKTKEKKYSAVTLDFNNIHIQEHVLPLLHSNLKEIAEETTVKVANLPDTKVFNDIKSEDEGFNSRVPLREKYKMFKENIHKGTVGFLCMYKKSTKIDRLGRHGDGIPIWSRFAIYRGCKKVDKGYRMVFEVYRASDFWTKIHQQMELEISNPTLPSMKVEMNFEELGILDKYTGTDYHFNYPIQYKEADSIYMRTTEMYGNQLATVFGAVRLPMVAKYVLDDFGVEYNKEKLDEAIKETAKVLWDDATNRE